MSRPSSRYPTAHELEILKIVWRERKVTARQVRDELSQKQPRAYTSVVTVMTIMARKKYLRRAKNNGYYYFTSIVSRDAITKMILADILNRLFDGSVSEMTKALRTIGKKSSR